MATQRWTDGGGDGDWGNGANWSSGVPASSDTVIIDSSNRNIITGMDQSLINLAALKILRGFTGNIGSHGNMLQVSVANTPRRTIITGGKDVWLQASTSLIVNTYINQASKDGHVRIQGQYTDIAIAGGRVTVTGNINTVGDMAMFVDESTRESPKLTINEGVLVSGTLHAMTGDVALHNNTWGAMPIVNTGATITIHNGNNGVDQYDGITILKGGTYNGIVVGGLLDASDPGEGTIGTLTFAAGDAVLDFRGLDSPPTPIQIGNPIIRMPEVD